MAAEIVNTAEYRASLKRRAISGELAPAIEKDLLDRCFGKTVDELVVSRQEDFSDLSLEELIVVADKMKTYLAELTAQQAPPQAPTSETVQ